jgi:hypothetical protein
VTARVWDEGDPEPKDRPAVVCDDGVTATWSEDDWWCRQEFKHHGTYVLGGSMGMDWPELLADHGPVREATADEAETVIVRYTS